MSELLEARQDGVVTLTLNRPERMNAFSDPMIRGLIEALPRLGADPAVGAIILTGAGRGFCAGGDVKAMATRGEFNFEERLEDLRFRHQVTLMLRTIPKVVIAMVNGAAIGAGFSLALACDLRVAGRAARFATGFVGVGYSGDFGGTWTLTQLVGTARARELFYLGDMIDAARAETLGIVNRVVDDAALLAETTTLARRLADGPRVALGYMKRNLHAAESEPLAAVLDMEAMHQMRAAQTEDHREAARAFVEKRQPVFKGR